jgi:hypothetical protein
MQRIAFCHLESLTGLPALNRLFESHGDRIGLVLVSRRFDTAHGGFFAQLVASVRKSGVRMTFWLGFCCSVSAAGRRSRPCRRWPGVTGLSSSRPVTSMRRRPWTGCVPTRPMPCW